MPRLTPDLTDVQASELSGYVFRSSRRHPRDPELVCYAPDVFAHRFSYVGTARIDGSTLHAYRVTVAPEAARLAATVSGPEGLDNPRLKVRPYYVFVTFPVHG